jgi:hypothetical protein
MNELMNEGMRMGCEMRDFGQTKVGQLDVVGELDHTTK